MALCLASVVYAGYHLVKGFSNMRNE